MNANMHRLKAKKTPLNLHLYAVFIWPEKKNALPIVGTL